MSHVVLTCECREDRERLLDRCPIPGHGAVPPDPVDPRALVAAGEEAARHIGAAITSLMAARAAWVSRGLDDRNPLPRSLDHLAQTLVANLTDLRRWTAAARTVAERRSTHA